ncbi:MAG TPA: hypothetical protein DD381_07940 [Lentisphaeria bacterium]|nr:MAG: hypothetical protein A2X47_04505 [Lentisphaerae bacterium GWF2_38_69]HBM16252.1 hypothetical protein [Lentisphaeria bacterium]
MNCDLDKISHLLLHKLGCTIEIMPYTSHIKTRNFEDFFSICKLFTLESWLHPVNLNDDEIQKKIGNKEEYTKIQLTEIEKYIRNELYSKASDEYQLEECEVIINL